MARIGIDVDEFVELQNKLLNTIKKENCYLVKALVLNDDSKESYYHRLKKFKKDKRVSSLHSKIKTYGEMLAIEENNPIKSAFMLNNAFDYMTKNEQEQLKLKNKELNHRIKHDNAKLEQDKDIVDGVSVIRELIKES